MKHIVNFLVLLASILSLGGCSQYLDDNVIFDSAKPANPCFVENDTTVVIIRDYFPRIERIDSITSNDYKVLPFSQAGTMDTIMVIKNNGASPISLSVLEVLSEGETGFIPVIRRASNEENLDQSKPFISTSSIHNYGKSFSVKVENGPASYLIFWQNTLLDSRFLSYNGEGSFDVTVPENAINYKRSYIRIYSSNKYGMGNDILIPLQYGKVISDASTLTRKDLQTQILYSVLIDRFYNGNTENDWKIGNPKEVHPKADYYGGDLAGITAKIKDGYFDSLGVNTIWLSPITENPYDSWGLYPDPKTKFSGYHGYWPIYVTKLDPRFGTSIELEELLDEAHNREQNVILDYVSNHMHIDSPTLKANPDWTTPSVTPDGRPNFELWDEFRLTTWFDKHIPTLDLEKEHINEPLTDSALFWMQKYDFDGFRHDATKHIPEVFWRKLTKKLLDSIPDRELYQIGETYGSPSLISSYVKNGMLDAQFDFNVYDSFVYATSEKKGSFINLANTINESLSIYGYHNLMGYITGNHDRARYISIVGGDLVLGEDYKAAGWKREIGISDSTAYDKLSMLHALIFTLPGLPCIYYGDEFGQPGGNDPDNREWAQFEGKNQREKEVFENVKTLAHDRRKSMPLLYGDYHELYRDIDAIVYVRTYMGKYVLVALNKADSIKSISITLPLELQYEGKSEISLDINPISSIILDNNN